MNIDKLLNPSFFSLKCLSTNTIYILFAHHGQCDSHVENYKITLTTGSWWEMCSTDINRSSDNCLLRWCSY